MEQELGAAVVGVGTYGETHARVYKGDHRVRLVSVWSKSRERSRMIGERYGCEHTTDLDEIAEDRRIQIVSIATPDFAHAQPALRMLEARKHVLIEKPMATSVKECEQILLASRRAGTKLMVNFHNRWYPPIARARKIIDSGEIGRLVGAFVRLSDVITVPTRMLSWSSKSGPEWFLFPHTVDLVRWLFGQEVQKVFSAGRKGVLKSRGIDTYDIIQAQMVMEEAVATVESSWILPESWRNNVVEFRMELYGEKGRIGIVGDNEGIEVSAGRYQTPFVYDFTTEDAPVRHFVDCVIDDRPPAVTGEDGLAATRIIEAVVNSLKSGQVVKVGGNS